MMTLVLLFGGLTVVAYFVFAFAIRLLVRGIIAIAEARARRRARREFSTAPDPDVLIDHPPAKFKISLN